MRVDRRAFGVDAQAATPQLSAEGQITAVDALLIVLVIGVGLYLDRFVELPVQFVGSIAVWAVMLRFLNRSRSDLRVIIIACLAWSSLGEAFASLVWGLYKYRLYNIPMFVPPGHVLMLLAALYLAERARWLMLALAPCVAVGYAIYALFTSQDMFSVVVTPIFVVSLIVGRKRDVYAATFLLAIALELYGTWLGNWRWASEAPWLDLSMANPPICIGALYCARDAMAGFTLTWLRRWQRRTHTRAGIVQPATLSTRGGVV
jgi:hypothetical protein